MGKQDLHHRSFSRTLFSKNIYLQYYLFYLHWNLKDMILYLSTDTVWSKYAGGSQNVFSHTNHQLHPRRMEQQRANVPIRGIQPVSSLTARESHWTAKSLRLSPILGRAWWLLGTVSGFVTCQPLGLPHLKCCNSSQPYGVKNTALYLTGQSD